MGTYSYTGSVQKITVGSAGTYDITGYGGAGGAGPRGGEQGGAGAEVSGNFSLQAGETLEVIVAGAGSNVRYSGNSVTTPEGGGGGGASTVLADVNAQGALTPGTYSQILLVAGGGGGGTFGGGAGKAGSANTGAAGGAGGAATGRGGGGGGAGAKNNGSIGFSNGSYNNGQGGSDTANGSRGGGAGSPGGSNGGFGGGGGGEPNGGGGGGGYTGGKAGGQPGAGAYMPGYGGTSYDAGTANAGQTISGENAGAGKVTITPNVAACYVSGTLIRTTRGDIAVEALQVGDLAVTASGAHRPIRWLGHRDTDCARHPEPRKVWPVRVAAGALGAGLPYADLWLSPNHALCLDDVLYPVRALVHCDLIQQVERATVTYWHVELDSHDLLIANGAPAESYLDTGNRSAFDNTSGVVDLHPDFEPRFTESFCRPYAESGPLVAAARYRLFGAAQTAAAPAVHLVADGLVLTPARCGNTLTFVVPAGAREVRLVSPRRRGDGADIRMLGVLIDAIVLETSAGRHDVALDDPRLFAGFHEVEHSTDGRWRWTDGAAHFAPSLWADADGAFVLRLTGMFDPPADEGSERIAA